MPVPTGWHPGEIAAQQARGYEDEVWGVWESYQEGAPSFMVPFLQQLPFLSVTTLDAAGRPWASLLCNDGNAGFLSYVDDGTWKSYFDCTIQAPVGVPIRECLIRLHKELASGSQPYDSDGNVKPHYQLAGVGVMLHNRRRNKLEGVIVAVEEIPTGEADNRFVFRMEVTSTFGNCPKYINMRNLLPAASTSPEASSVPASSGGSDARLPEEALSIIAAADTMFLATMHSGQADAYPADPSHMGNNIRGGPSGFLRTFWDEEEGRTCVVLPDWSGNRLMMSFGNMTSDPVAGIVIPVWSSKADIAGDALHLTCKAKVLANDEASSLIRGVKGAVKLWPQSWSLVRKCLPLYAASAGSPGLQGLAVGWSPYNPPVRLLTTEKKSLPSSSDRPHATLVDVHFYTPFLARFTFRSDVGLPYKPGQHIIMDCYDLLDTRVQLYTHMARFRGGEKDLNDDGTRSWTISYASTSSSSERGGEDGRIRDFELTLRRKGRGGVTPGLFSRGRLLQDAEIDTDAQDALRIPLLGVDGDCTLPEKPTQAGRNLTLTYILSGIGLTPMLPHLSQLLRRDAGGEAAEILAVMAVKWDEVDATKEIISRALSRETASSSALTVRALLLVGNAPPDEGGIETQEQKGLTTQDSVELPKSVKLTYEIFRGQRLQADSFDLPHTEDSKGFVLPADALDHLRRSDQLVICAGPAFAKVAREACQRADVAEDRIKLESFAF